MALSRKTEIIYIYDLPCRERRELCKILNQDDKWEELADKQMQFDGTTIRKLKKKKNPANEMLTSWGRNKRKISELFVMLSILGYLSSMKVLKSFVDEEFDRVLRNEETIDNMHVTAKVHKIMKKPVNALCRAITLRNTNNLHAGSPLESSNLVLKTRNNYMREIRLPRILYYELDTVTDSWHQNNILGKGAFGIVYKGVWKNSDVAIKKMMFKSDKGYMAQFKESFKEIEILDSLVHENIMPLYAYSCDGFVTCLIYQLMQNGSLEDRLLLRQESYPLTWMQRHNIAKGVARGLQFLHTVGEKPLIHGDIKSGNVLLDNNYQPKIANFYLASEGPQKGFIKVRVVQGTRNYLPDDYLNEKKLSTKVDTYSFGIILFELATGQVPYNKNKQGWLNKIIQNCNDDQLLPSIDTKAGKKEVQIYSLLMTLGQWCSNCQAHNRPEMEQVFLKLDAMRYDSC